MRLCMHVLKRQLVVFVGVIIVGIVPQIVHRNKIGQAFCGIALFMLCIMPKKGRELCQLMHPCTVQGNKEDQYIQAGFFHAAKIRVSGNFFKIRATNFTSNLYFYKIIPVL